MNLTLKIAIVKTGKPQYMVAAEAAMTETLLSKLIAERCAPTDAEKKRLASVLEVPVDQLFRQNQEVQP